MGKWTPGPWRWEFNPKTKTAQLCGGKPQFDSTVMDFIRVGMFGAGPRVIDQTDLGLLTGVAKFAQPSAGREHHSSWFQVLRHPDLDLIAAAPELVEALRTARDYVFCELETERQQMKGYERISRIDEIAADLAEIDAALAKAGVL